MEIEHAFKYVAAVPKRLGNSAKATPQTVEGKAQRLAVLNRDFYRQTDQGLREMAAQGNELRSFAIKSRTYLGPTKPARDPIGTPTQTGWISQRTAVARKYSHEEAAKEAFRSQSEALLRPGGWNDQPPGLTFADAPTWHLLDAHGNVERRNRRIQKGDILRIDAPGPDFFVKTERVHVDPNNVSFTVIPCADPNAQGKARTTHFFTDQASRTFMLQRDGSEVRFVTEGNNERLNIGSQSGGWKAPWNGASGAAIILGGGQVYWNSFAKIIMRK